MAYPPRPMLGREKERTHEQSVLNRRTARAMEMRTGTMLCPQSDQAGEFSPGETCPYCGYYLRCIGCGD